MLLDSARPSLCQRCHLFFGQGSHILHLCLKQSFWKSLQVEPRTRGAHYVFMIEAGSQEEVEIIPICTYSWCRQAVPKCFWFWKGEGAPRVLQHRFFAKVIKMDIFQQQDFLTFLQMLICSNIKIDRLWILCCWREHREAQLKKDLEFCPVLQKQLPLEDSLGISSRNPPSWPHVTPSGVHRWEEMSAGGNNFMSVSCLNLPLFWFSSKTLF